MPRIAFHPHDSDDDAPPAVGETVNRKRVGIGYERPIESLDAAGIKTSHCVGPTLRNKSIGRDDNEDATLHTSRGGADSPGLGSERRGEVGVGAWRGEPT
jgi:hypothetical protein